MAKPVFKSEATAKILSLRPKVNEGKLALVKEMPRPVLDIAPKAQAEHVVLIWSRGRIGLALALEKFGEEFFCTPTDDETLTFTAESVEDNKSKPFTVQSNGKAQLSPGHLRWLRCTPGAYITLDESDDRIVCKVVRI